MRAVAFGTAGHIDHGKTSLVKALTGVDCDRLPEEKRRGITLVLGFAPLADPLGEVELSFIDVPGHERLVHTMIAGAAGIDRALLVVAADEGVMPQTREHLSVLEVLGVRGGVVALTKADLVAGELLEVRRHEVERYLEGGPLAGAPVIPCSVLGGSGVAAVRDAVLACARGVERTEDPHRPFRIAADRVFTIAGSGTVVTGTAHWGEVRPGDELTALPSGASVRVRGVQVHGDVRDRAGAGERVALGLAGVRVDQLPRGEQLLSGGAWSASRRLAVEVRLLDEGALAEGDRVFVHILAARALARVERSYPAALGPGESGRVMVHLARPVFAVPGDRVVLRRLSPAATLGGGEVLDAQPERLRRRDAAQLARLPRPWRDLPATLDAWIRLAGARGATGAELAARLGLREGGLEAALGRLVAAGAIVVARTRPPLLVHAGAAAAARERAAEVLRVAAGTGVPLAEFVARALPDSGERLREFFLADFRRAGVVRESAGRVFAAGAAPLEDALAAQVAEVYRRAGLAAPSPGEAAAALGADPKVVEGIVRFLVDGKRLARVGGKWVLHRQVLDEIVASLRGWGVEGFDVAAFKERFGLTRKLAIPILEWLDSERVTRREGERRRLVRPRPGTTPGA
ncbi:MAG: selenocysteine-specific translation elongation factor [Thermoanaerobaculaceae bacterium]|nr:selenocysteine-specific translation elongation factor [Thermoanaerobaculaceae bacterium]